MFSALLTNVSKNSLQTNATQAQNLHGLVATPFVLLYLKLLLVFTLWRRETSPFFHSNVTRPGFTRARWPGEKGRVKNTDVPPWLTPDLWHCSGLGPFTACIFPLLPQKHCRSTSHRVFPNSEKPAKVREISRNKWHISHFFSKGLSMPEDFNIVFGLGGKFPLMWLGGRVRKSDTGR